MDEISFWEFVGITGVLFGGAAFLMGQAIAETWRPMWQNVAYGFLLALGNHFLDAALFGGSWTNLVHYLLDAAVIIVIALFAYRLTLTHRMVAQYPWLYERVGLLSWRNKGGEAGKTA